MQNPLRFNDPSGLAATGSAIGGQAGGYAGAVLGGRIMNKEDSIQVVYRELFYSLKGNDAKKKFAFRVFEPRLVDETKVSFKFDEGTASCTVYLEGLDEDDIKIYGIDKLHALSQALDIDRFLKGFSSKYDFYWLTGDPYFD